MISVLYVDDEPDLLEIAKLFLEESGEFSVGTSTSAKEALESPAIRSYDAIIADYLMPGMDGIAFLKAVREGFGDLPFILFTGRGREEIVIAAINNGADFYIQKGGDPEAQFAELAHKIRQAVSRRRAELALRTNEERLRMAQEIAGTGSWEYSPATNTIWGSAEGLRIFGFPPVAGNFPIADIEACIPERERVNTALVDLISRGTEYNLEYVINPADGSPKKVIHSVARLEKDPAGNLIRVIGVIQDITESSHVKEEITFKNAILSAQQEASPDAILVVDENAMILNYNRKFVDIWGIPGNLIVSREDGPVLQHVTDQLADPEAFASRVRHLYATREDMSYDELLLKDGRILERFSSPMHGESGKYYGRVWYFRDISERRKAEEALRENEEKYRRLIETSLEGIWILDRDFRVTFANSRMADILGYPAEELPGHRITEFISPEESGEAERELEERRKGISGHFERTHLRRDGSPVMLLVSATPIISNDGSFQGTFSMCTDISDRKRAEESLHQQVLFMQKLIDTIPSPVFFKDAEGIYRGCNAAFEQFIGLPKAQIIGKTLYDIAPGRLADLYYEYDKVLFEKPGTRTFESQLRAADGTLRDIILNKATFADEDEGNVILVGVVQDITERKRAEDALRQSEAKFRGMAERISDIVLLVDKDLLLTYVSPSLLEMLGKVHADLLGKPLPIGNLSHAEQEKIRAAFLDNKALKTTGPLEISLPVPGGDPIILEFHGIPIEEGGVFQGVQLVAHDITGRKQTEEALRKSRLLLAEAMDLAHLVNWEHDLQTNIFTFDDRFYALYGTTAEREGGYQMPAEVYTREFVHPEDRGVVLEEAEKAIKTTDPHYVSQREHRIIRRDGEIRYIIVRIGVIKDAEGRTIRTRGANQDITDVRKTEKALRESEERHRSLVETSSSMIWEIDPQGRFRYISPVCRTIMGYAPEELVGKPITDLIPEQSRSFVLQDLARHVSTEGSIAPFEVPARHRNGRDLIIEIRSSRITDTYGKLIGFRGMAYDVTERRKAEEVLKLANRQLSLLGSITRHDLLNKITVILGYLKIAEKNCRDPALDSYLKKIRSATSVIKSQLEFTRVYQDLGTHEPQWIMLDEVMPRAQVPATITLDSKVQGVVIFADPMLERVFFNLLDNSTRHGEHVTEIRVSSRKEGEALVVVWEDNGIGIAAAEKEQIFERGFGENTGLGMFLVREILSLTGITITETGKPGSGARFEIVVPDGAYRIEA